MRRLLQTLLRPLLLVGVLVSGIIWIPGMAAQVPKRDKGHAEKMQRGLEVFKQQVRPILVNKCWRVMAVKKLTGNSLSSIVRNS